MKACIVLLLIPLSLRAQEDLSSRVREERLDQRNPVVVRVSEKSITTLQFPDPIQSESGAEMTVDQEKEDGEFLVFKGKNWINVQALKPGKEQNLNVILNGQVYVVVLRASALHDYAVVFTRERIAQPVALAPEEPTAQRVEGLFKKLVNYDLLQSQDPAAYIDVDTGKPCTPTGTDRLEVQVQRALRDNGKNAVALDVAIRNKSDAPFRYDPSAIEVRVKGDVFPVSLAHGSGEVPPHGEDRVQVALSGDLSVRNDFTAIVKERP